MLKRKRIFLNFTFLFINTKAFYNNNNQYKRNEIISLYENWGPFVGDEDKITPFPLDDRKNDFWKDWKDQDFRRISREYEELKISMKELNDKMNDIYLDTLKNKSQLNLYNTEIYILIGVISFLFFVLVCIGLFKLFIYIYKNKNKQTININNNNINRLLLNIDKKNNLLLIPNNKNRNKIKINDKDIDVNDEESNYNILINNSSKKEKSIIDSIFFEGAPIIDLPNDEEIKTKTNNEDIYIQSNTDKFLYKPYPKNDI